MAVRVNSNMRFPAERHFSAADVTIITLFVFHSQFSAQAVSAVCLQTSEREQRGCVPHVERKRL